MASITDEQIVEAFTLFDATESGALGVDEFILAMKGLGFGDVSVEDATATMSQATSSKSAEAEEEGEKEEKAAAPVGALTVDLPAFATIVKNRQAPKDSAAEIERAFSLFLKTGSAAAEGAEPKTSIDLETMLAVARRLGQKDDEALLLEMIAEASVDRKGTSISLEEFANVMEIMKDK